MHQHARHDTCHDSIEFISQGTEKSPDLPAEFSDSAWLAEASADDIQEDRR